MFVKYLLPAFVAVGSVAAQSSTCTVSATATINSQADATKYANCDTIKGSILIGTTAGSNIDISGPKQITGDLKVLNNGAISTFQSTTLQSIGGSFTLNNVTQLITLTFSNLTSVQTLAWQSVTNLNSLNLGPITKADEVTVSDTFLNSLDGIDLTSVSKLDINNNRRLTKISTQLNNLSDNLNIQANGLDLEVDLPKLVWIANMTIANVTTFSIPSLKVVNGSARFDSNKFTSFAAPNLTQTTSGDISFVGNAALTNMSFPQLKSIGGGLLIANNTGLDKINFFNKLENVGGAVKLRGNFTDVEFPALDVVKGAFDVSSTADISSSCTKLKSLSGTNGNGKVEGVFSCTSNNSQANSDTGTNTSTTGTDGSGSSSSDSGNGASAAALNAALFGLVGVAALALAL